MTINDHLASDNTATSTSTTTLHNDSIDGATITTQEESKDQIKEYYFSTTTLPHWHDEYRLQTEEQIKKYENNDNDDTQSQVYANNICLIDTPGYGSSIDVRLKVYRL